MLKNLCPLTATVQSVAVGSLKSSNCAGNWGAPVPAVWVERFSAIILDSNHIQVMTIHKIRQGVKQSACTGHGPIYEHTQSYIQLHVMRVWTSFRFHEFKVKCSQQYTKCIPIVFRRNRIPGKRCSQLLCSLSSTALQWISRKLVWCTLCIIHNQSDWVHICVHMCAHERIIIL